MTQREIKPRPIIICPTAVGGHMDHAMDLALSAVDQGYPRPIIVSRTGSLGYASKAVLETVDVVDSLPPLVPQEFGKIRRLSAMLASLVREHWVIRKIGRRSGGPFTLVFQEPRYPWPRVLSWRTPATGTTLILHNAVEHTGGSAALSTRFQAWIRSSCLRQATRVVTFGDEQAHIARSSTRRPVRSFVLPRSTRIVHDQNSESDLPQFLGLVCIGELRPNKGIEVAIEAAGRLGEELHVVGREVEPEYLKTLVRLAAAHPTVSVMPRFLSPAEFDRAISYADCVLLPYVQFDAQSGVLAKASAFGVPMIVSDLPSLREQVREDDDAVMVAPGDVEALADAVAKFRTREAVTARQLAPDLAEWDRLIRACTEGW